jgi:hypothetical protein
LRVLVMAVRWALVVVAVVAWLIVVPLAATASSVTGRLRRLVAGSARN